MMTTESGFSSQWSNLLQNLGIWQGSFTKISPTGEIVKDTPTRVTLEGLNNNQTIRQTIEKFTETGDKLAENVLEYSYLNRSILLFEAGHFSVGSMQFAPSSEFGAELGFIQGDRRLRIVPTFGKDSQLLELTLIREYRQETAAFERPFLTVEQLLGEWEGEAITRYPDWRSPDRYTSHLSLEGKGDRLQQTLKAPGLNLTSTGTIKGSTIEFTEGEQTLQILLLPDGASCCTPRVIENRKSFFLEAGWLVSDRERWRLIRSYDRQGGWSSLTSIEERKIGP